MADSPFSHLPPTSSKANITITPSIYLDITRKDTNKQKLVKLTIKKLGKIYCLTFHSHRDSIIKRPVKSYAKCTPNLIAQLKKCYTFKCVN